MDIAPLYDGLFNSILSLQVNTMHSLKRFGRATSSFKSDLFLTTDYRKMNNVEAKHLSNDSCSVPREIM